MRIDKAIFAVDDNINYQGFWEINSEICKKHLNITPVLFKITDDETDFYEDSFGLIKHIKRIPNINTGFQAQIYRIYGTKYFTEEVCLIHDIDLFFIDRLYLEEKTKSIDENDLVILCADGYDSARPECVGIYSGDEFRYPLHGIIGKGELISRIIQNEISFEEFINAAISLGYNQFDTDEIYLHHV